MATMETPAATATPAPTNADGAESTDLSRQYDTQLGLAHTTIEALKARIKQHYDLASDYYVSLWGEHIHHGYWPTDESKASESKETAQANLIRLLLSISGVGDSSSAALDVLDVGCGVGGTSRCLASDLGCRVTGITISTRQVEIAKRLSAGTTAGDDDNDDDFQPVGKGHVRFLELDAEKMGDYFLDGTADTGLFDVVWISEALSHFPDKALFFRNAQRVLRPGGKLVLADWFKAEGLSAKAFDTDIKPIEDGMLLPPLCTQSDYVTLATGAGLRVHAPPKDISADVSKTWDLSWDLVQKPSLWAFALSQGRDGIAFLQAFRAMRRGYGNGSFRYAVMCFEK
ncbi:gamma-tocopherol methyltransferase [Grosmannia clavigera kw1407]|uniref:Gamma-tocopherol methyltransferase n=1 Tax=Grosmannia clavigera (strain kw1407 / UAMH 11150) TaxID=655863 RepID=F0XLL3_GROCL|nr:gamma-tocopherol methyltransferase [Grosmannia clavigera kw1407]EFX01070.1 gamma-tocopherol methyltransferase [Grosmannia clavigera kw1407]